MINREKCKLYTNEISTLGHIVNEGVSPDPEKITTIINIEQPSNVSEVRQFLGMFNQLNKFIPHLADHTKLIREEVAIL